jgi:hypothetical protein
MGDAGEYVREDRVSLRRGIHVGTGVGDGWAAVRRSGFGNWDRREKPTNRRKDEKTGAAR